MKFKFTAAALFAATSFVALPFPSFAQDKPAADAPKATTSAESKVDGAEAAWKEINDLKEPTLDRTKTKDQEYVKGYVAELQSVVKKRSELCVAFVEKYPTDAHVPDALHMRALTIMRYGGNRDEFVKAAEAFLKAAPKDDRGAQFSLALANMEKDEAKQLEMFRAIVEAYPNNPATAQAKGALKMAEAVGKPFELSFKDAISGKEIAMKDLKGKVVVVDFWATWCGPCVAEMPTMKKLYAQFKEKGVEFIGVSLDQAEDKGGLTKLKEFVAKNEITWPQYYQGNFWDSEFSKGWGVNSIPCVFVVDADGNLASTRARGKLEELLPKLLEKAGKKEVTTSSNALPF